MDAARPVYLASGRTLSKEPSYARALLLLRLLPSLEQTKKDVYYSFTYSTFMHSFYFFLSAYEELGIVLDARNVTVNRTDKYLSPCGTCILLGKC